VHQARAADAIMSPLTARRMATPHLARDEARPIANLPELIHKKSRHLEVPFGAGEPKTGYESQSAPQAADSGIVAMLKVESAPLLSLLLLIATPTIADGIGELDRCELRRSGCIRLRSQRVSRIGQNGQRIYRNAPRMLKRACERPVIVSPRNVPLPSKPMKAV
jgi:hypothetical protein